MKGNTINSINYHGERGFCFNKRKDLNNFLKHKQDIEKENFKSTRKSLLKGLKKFIELYMLQRAYGSKLISKLNFEP